MPYSFNDTIERAKEEYGLGKGETFKVKDGDNRIRVLSAALGYESDYQGKKNFKFVMWVLDRRDGQVKPYFAPMTIMNAIGSLQTDADFAFEEVPMPYDINIKATNAGTKEVEYNVVPSPKQVPLTDEEMAAYRARPTIDEFVEKLKEKQGGTSGPSYEQKSLEDQVNHVRNLMKMKGITDERMHDLGIPVEKMTSETYPEYIELLKAQPFNNAGEDINVEDVPF